MQTNTDRNYGAVVFHKFENLMVNIFLIISSGGIFYFSIFFLDSKAQIMQI